PHFYMELSRVLQQLDRPAEEKVALEKVISLDANSAEAHYALAQLAKKQGDSDASKSELEQTQRIRDAQTQRDVALGFVRSGVVLAKKGNYDDAVADFRKALEINPELGEAHFNLAGALLQKGETQAALESFRAALKLAPQWPEAHYQLGRTLVL